MEKTYDMEKTTTLGTKHWVGIKNPASCLGSLYLLH